MITWYNKESEARQARVKNCVVTERNEPTANGCIQFSKNETSVGQNETLDRSDLCTCSDINRS